MGDLEDQQEEHFGRMLRKVEEADELHLTDEDWMSIIARDRDGLPICCANISALRDVLTEIAHDDGKIGFLHKTELARTLTWCFPEHPVPSEAMQCILEQLGWEMFEYHKKSKIEL